MLVLEHKLERAPIAECMTSDPITVAPDVSVLDAARLMLKHKIGGLPVVEGGRVVGMITESDLFRLLIRELAGPDPSDDP
jgi:CBS domain-containing protein